MKMFARWLRFNFVGGIGIIVQFVFLFLMKSVLHLDYLTATASSVEAAVVHNFLRHERYTWADRVQGSSTARTSAAKQP
jgi:putative flippase GtrA